jgi:ABC-type transport system involved in multi-copper enzyme maturation permease subunit
MRLLRFTGFTLLEYLRSGRVVIEVIALLSIYAIFFRRPMNAEYFFSVQGVFTPALTLYTMAAMIGLGDRPQAYVLLSRGVGRPNFLLGLFLAACTVVAGAYGVLSLLVAVLNRPPDMGMPDWLLGSLPLMLNIGLLAALMLMLSPLVFPTIWRLFVLGLIALAFSSNFIGGQLLLAMPEMLRTVLRAVQALLGGPLVPAFYGFQLAVTRDYSTTTAIANLLAQGSLLLSLLGLALYAFARRDLIFSMQ